jgi:hypothetical protein
MLESAPFLESNIISSWSFLMKNAHNLYEVVLSLVPRKKEEMKKMMYHQQRVWIETPPQGHSSRVHVNNNDVLQPIESPKGMANNCPLPGNDRTNGSSFVMAVIVAVVIVPSDVLVVVGFMRLLYCLKSSLERTSRLLVHSSSFMLLHDLL